MIDSEHDNFPLELSPEAMSELLERVKEKLVVHIATLPQQAASNVANGEALADKLREPLPKSSLPVQDLLDQLFDEAISTSFNSAGPGYMAYIPGGGLFHAAIADLISKAVNRYVGVWTAAPGLVQIETNVVRWFCEIVGYPNTAGGFLTTGGSLANFSALFTARRERLPENFLSGTIYTSDQAHHSVQKAAVLAGFPASHVRIIPTDSLFRMRTDTLRHQIIQDQNNGFTPFAVVANAGTTNSGAIDDLQAIGEICTMQSLWLHIDAAYGGFFMLTERGKTKLRGLELADSITLDPHKSLFLPYGTGSLLVRDASALKRAHSAPADYMPAMQENPDLIDFCQISPELTREFRGLRVWLPIKMHGIDAIRKCLDEKLDLAEWIAAKLAKIESLRIVAEPQLSVVTFRIDRVADTANLNELTREVLRNINSRRRVFLTGTLLGEYFTIRICVLCFRTHLREMQLCLEDIEAACQDVLGDCNA